MSFIDNIINEFDIALKTLSNKKSGTSRGYPAEESPENLTQEEKKRIFRSEYANAQARLAEHFDAKTARKIMSLSNEARKATETK